MKFIREPSKVKPVRKKRKMSEEAKKAAAERLAIAREKRKLANPPKLEHVHPNVRALEDDSPLSYKNVMAWIRYNKEQIPGLRKNVRMGAKGSIAKLADIEGYIRNLQTYIRTGTYIDMFYGADQEKKVRYRTIVPAGTTSDKYSDD